MRIAKLDQRIEIQENSKTTTNGVKTDSWATIETVYGSLDPVSSFERRVAEQNGEIITHRVLMRYRNDIGSSDTEVLPKYRLVIDGFTYAIRSVINPDFRNRMFRLTVEELVD